MNNSTTQNPYLLPGISLVSEKVIQVWENQFRISLNQIKKKDRHESVIIARDLLIYALRKYTRLSYYEIGVIVNCGHSNALKACRKVENLYFQDKKLKAITEPFLTYFKEIEKPNGITLTVELDKWDLIRLLPPLNENQMNWSLNALWNYYKERYK